MGIISNWNFEFTKKYQKSICSKRYNKMSDETESTQARTEEQNQGVEAGESKPEIEQEVKQKSTAEEQAEEKSKTVTIQPPAEDDDTLPEDFVPPTREELQRKKSVAGLGKYLQGFLGNETFDDFLRTYAPVIPESKVIYGAEPIQNKWKRNPNTGYWQR